MEPTDRQLLLSLRAALGRRHVWNIGDGDTARLLKLCTLAVDELLHRQATDEDALLSLRAQLEGYCNTAYALAAKGQVGHLIKRSSLPARIPTRQQLTADIQALSTELSHWVAAIYCARGDPDADPEWIQDVDAFLREVMRAEAAGAARTPPPEAISSENPAAQTLERLADASPYFSKRCGLPLRVESVKQLAGGFSNETFSVVLGDERDGTRTLVVRKAKPVGIMTPYVAKLEEEFSFVRLAYEAGLPVAKPLWFESNPKILGQSFVVCRFVSGSNIAGHLRPEEPVNDAVLRKLAQLAARLHTLPWKHRATELPRRFVPDARITVAQTIELMLDRLQVHWTEGQLKPSPILEMLNVWLRRNIPQSAASPVITHGDFGFHNMLWDAGEIAALLDWETAMLCSPAKDLANLEEAVVGPARWPEFLHWYVEAGGTWADDSELHYYRVLRRFQSVLCGAMALEKMFTRADPLNIDYLELGIPTRAYFFREMERQVEWLLGSVR